MSTAALKSNESLTPEKERLSVTRGEVFRAKAEPAKPTKLLLTLYLVFAGTIWLRNSYRRRASRLIREPTSQRQEERGCHMEPP